MPGIFGFWILCPVYIYATNSLIMVILGLLIMKNIDGLSLIETESMYETVEKRQLYG
jgi:hypothetical protein